jgi:6-phosphogluconolactonase/glucosamine-6-phosphate isomerase/deaminase
MSAVVETSYAGLAELFVKEMGEVQKNTAGKIYVGLSGGSTLPPLLKAISKTAGAENLTQVVFTFIDERLVPYSDEGSNYGAMKNAIETCGLAALPLPSEDCQTQASEYMKTIAGNSLPALDLLLLGYGDDGHIASLFPKSAELEKPCSPGNWLFRAKASYAPKERWSWGMEALTNSKKTFCLYKGNPTGTKAKKLSDALNLPECNTPLAQFIRQTKGDVTYFRTH